MLCAGGRSIRHSRWLTTKNGGGWQGLGYRCGIQTIPKSRSTNLPPIHDGIRRLCGPIFVHAWQEIMASIWKPFSGLGSGLPSNWRVRPPFGLEKHAIKQQGWMLDAAWWAQQVCEAFKDVQHHQAHPEHPGHPIEPLRTRYLRCLPEQVSGRPYSNLC